MHLVSVCYHVCIRSKTALHDAKEACEAAFLETQILCILADAGQQVVLHSHTQKPKQLFHLIFSHISYLKHLIIKPISYLNL